MGDRDRNNVITLFTIPTAGVTDYHLLVVSPLSCTVALPGFLSKSTQY